jgi:3-deoxy-manno-octulosonate cytidylyltransferase (CMP-KDO synthetase)
MKAIALIPARYAATRFPGKLMEPLAGRSVILTTYENTVATGLFDEVIVVTDSSIIYNEITQNKGRALMSRGVYESGSDRIAEAAAGLEAGIIINVQGDEPFVKKQPLADLLQVLIEGGEKVQVASLMHPIGEKTLITDPNAVKVVVDKDFHALYFSRSVIPYPRNPGEAPLYYKHIGIYGYRKEALMLFTTLGVCPLEAAEKLEQLRYLENGIRIRMVVTDEAPVSIDTPEDLARARALM